MNDDKYIIKPRDTVPSTISCSVTWVDGRIPFFRSKYFDKLGRAWYGVCSFSRRIWAITPLDYDIPSLITTISVSPSENYCEKAYSCLYFDCQLNRFNRGMFEAEFKDCGSFSLGLPQDIGTKPLWFNEGKWATIWEKFIIPVVGGSLKFDANKAKKLDI